MAVRSVKCEDVCLRSLKTVTQSFSSRKIQHLGGIQSRSAAGAIVPLRAAPSVPPRSGLLRDGNCEVLTGWLAFSTARLIFS